MPAIKAERLPAKVVRPVTETVRLIGALGELAGDQEALSKWLHAPNEAFADRSPLDLIKAGESDEIWQMVHQLRQGSFA